MLTLGFVFIKKDSSYYVVEAAVDNKNKSLQVASVYIGKTIAELLRKCLMRLMPPPALSRPKRLLLLQYPLLTV